MVEMAYENSCDDLEITNRKIGENLTMPDLTY